MARTPRPARPAPTRERLAAAFGELERLAPVPHGWRPEATAKALRGLRREIQRIPAATEIERFELGRLLWRINDLDFRARLAISTLRRWRRLLTQIEAFAERVRSEPGRAYAYRRRRHRGLLARKKELETLVRLLGIALPLLDTVRVDPALRDLAARFRFVPPSRAEAEALRAHLGLADQAAAQAALATCTGEVCAVVRGERSPEAMQEDTVEGCPGGACAAFRKAIDTAGPAWRSLSRRNGGALDALILRRSAKNMN